MRRNVDRHVKAYVKAVEKEAATLKKDVTAKKAPVKKVAAKKVASEWLAAS